MSTQRLLFGCGVVVAAVLLYVVIKKANEPAPVEIVPPPPDPAVEAILEKRGRIVWDESSPDRPVVSVRFADRLVTDEHLKLLAPFPDLQAVHLVATSVSDDGLKHLRHLSHLRTLDLRVTPIGDFGLKDLRHFPELETLILRETKVTDAGMKEIAQLQNLRVLNLEKTAVTGDGLQHIKGLKHLESIDLPPACGSTSGVLALRDLGLLHRFPGAYTQYGKSADSPEEVATLIFRVAPLTVESLDVLKSIADGRRLKFEESTLDDSVLKWLRDCGWIHMTLEAPPNRPAGLSGLPGLRDEIPSPASDGEITSLYLGYSAITDAGLANIMGLQKLQYLDLRGTSLTVQSLAVLKDLPLLETLRVADIRITIADLKLLNSRPNLRLFGAELDWSDQVLKEARESSVLHLLPLVDGEWHADAIDLTERCIELSHSKVTDAGLRELKSYEGLTQLDLTGTAVSDAGIAELVGHTQLRILTLDHTKVTDAGLTQIQRMHWLKGLHVWAPGVTAAGIKSLKAALPKCFVEGGMESEKSDRQKLTVPAGPGGPGR